MYRAGLEHLLGVTKVGDTLRIAPCVPRAWPEYEVAYRFGAATYRIRVLRPDGVQRTGARMIVDGVTLAEPVLSLVDDGREHAVLVEPLGV
jgi:cyclic beta-1,2-glucan synthetase